MHDAQCMMTMTQERRIEGDKPAFEYNTCNQSNQCNQCVTEKYSNIRPSEVDYIKKNTI